jgi:DNA-binding beta-propeller fold protein YncE
MSETPLDRVFGRYPVPIVGREPTLPSGRRRNPAGYACAARKLLREFNGRLSMTIAKTMAGVLVLAASAVASAVAVAEQGTPTYSIVSRIAGSGKSWDYAVVDEKSSRFYVAQQGVTAVDLNTGKITTGLVTAKMTHGLAVLGDGTVAVDDAASKTITVFNGADGKILSTIPTAEFNPVNGVHALDAMILEPTSGLLVAINGVSGLMLLVDIKQARVVGTISIGGHPEFAAANEKGTVYVNEESGKISQIVAVDISSRKVVQKIPVSGCEGPTGLAYDQRDDLLISVCGDNGVTKFIHAKTGREAASINVGKGADAVMFDPQRHFAFIASAEDGTLSVLAVRSAADIAVVQTLATQKGTRLGAVDSSSGRVYLPAAKFGPPVAPSPYPSVVPGTFEIMVVAPN